MTRIERGAAAATFEIDNDGILRARWSGVVLASTAGELSACLLRAMGDAGARAAFGDLRGALLAMPAVDPNYYRWLPEPMRSIPVGMLVSAEQAPLYAGLARAAAGHRTLRKAVRSAEDGERWLQEQVRAFAANRMWWQQRSPQPAEAPQGPQTGRPASASLRVG